MKKFNYENKQYLEKLNELSDSYYSKYISFIQKYLKNKASFFLDVGCGNGLVLDKLKKRGYDNGYGIDISRLFIEETKSKGLDKIYYYDGNKFPFKDKFFDLIGSFNVLEHTQNPEVFIKEQVLKLKPGGFIIVACPNFLSVLFNSNHRKLKGIKNKTKNFITIFNKIIFSKYGFEKMSPLIKKNFEYDDDAIVVTNMLDLRHSLINSKCTIVYESGFINYDSLLYKLINTLPFMIYMLPSCFVIAKKNK